jgi:hypothetical protein
MIEDSPPRVRSLPIAMIESSFQSPKQHVRFPIRLFWDQEGVVLRTERPEEKKVRRDF